MASYLAFPTRVVRALALVLAVLIGAGLLATLAVSPARADDTDGISGAPADASGPDQRSRFSYQATPGQHIDDLYVASNTGTTAQTMVVFATDAYNTDDGGYGLLDTDAVPVDAGSWVSFAGGVKQLSIPLEPGASQVIPFSLDVPADAAPGDHAAGVVISVQSTSGEILVDRRVATRMYVRVPGELQPALTISNISANYAAQINPFAGDTTVTYTVTNSGNVALGASVVVGVKALFGVSAAETEREEMSEILPGNERTFTTVVDGVGQWGYLNPYVQLAPSVDVEALNPGPLASVSRDTTIFVTPWWLIVLLLLVGGTFLFRRWRAKRDEKSAKAWMAYQEAEMARRVAEGGTATGAEQPVGPGDPALAEPVSGRNDR
ncbi:dihydroorotate dehydrogenase (fumarate) [Glaciihabitans tibetensis]|uniref:Dihydroorotate dehydrogenase (Fumarate) n=1 Tax=Glaciihabitans tibetensis TaxID=1266600 RepID=A0A2T0VBC7_9MICO|nr:hypothetical protein [Glaciihabitans tibetensis]PRY67495.1 dihydroorotate dehydrogenase (fumarate) [Glaciihabitans tibetensis]